MCVICEPAAHAAAARVLNAARMERACPLHVRCGCLGGRRAGPVTATRRGRCEGVRSPRQSTIRTVGDRRRYFPRSQGPTHTDLRVLGTKQKVCCPAPAKSNVYEKVYSVVSAMTRTSLISSHSHVACRVIGLWCDVCVVSALGLARYPELNAARVSAETRARCPVSQSVSYFTVPPRAHPPPPARSPVFSV